MKSALAFATVLLLAGGFAWLWIALRKFAARRKAGIAREAAFVAGLAARPKPAPVPEAPAEAPAGPVEAASSKIKDALGRGRGAEAVSVFTAHLEHRARLALAPGEWEALGRLLLAQGSFLEAAWALHAGAVLAGDAAAAQKRLVEVAGKASASGQPQAALRLYATVLEKYPASEYAPFVRSNMRIEERKLKP